MASGWFIKGLHQANTKQFDWVADTNIKVMLVSASYTFDPDHDFVDDVVAAELSGTGYTGGFGGSGRKALTSKTATMNTTSNRLELDAADSLWTAINAGTARAAVVFREVTSDALSPLIGYLQLAVDKATNGGDLTFSYDSTGLLHITA